MRGIVYVVVAFILCSCLNPANERLAQLKKLGIQEIEVGDVRFKCKQMNIEINNAEAEEGDNIIYFNVRIEKKNNRQFEKGQLLYLVFDMQHDFHLKMDSQERAPIFFQKIENGRANEYEYIIAFDSFAGNQEANLLTLVYTDKIFGAGMVAFVHEPLTSVKTKI